MNLLNVGKTMQDLRKIVLDKSQKEVAEYLGISKSYVSLIETKRQIPTLEIINKFSELIQLEIDEIFLMSRLLDEKEPNKLRKEYKKCIDALLKDKKKGNIPKIKGFA
jgi:transcriptional regulator with XRE-family HTH domain